MGDDKILEGTEAVIRQIGVVVKDLDKTIKHLTSIGLGPFERKEAIHPSTRMRGRKVSYEVGLGFAQQGPVQIELIEYRRGETIQKEFLDEKGEGLHHICFQVKDIDATVEKFTRKGIKVLQQDRFIGGGGLAYMGTDDIGGIIIELVQLPPDFDPEVGLQYEKY